MKKIVSTQGLTYGEFNADSISAAVSERINNRLEYSFYQSYNEKVHTAFDLSYNVIAGEITQIVLDYTIDNPTPTRLEWFREHCDNFFELNHFIVDDNEKNDPHIYFFASDLFDMSSLIHAFDVLTISLESIMCAIDVNLTDCDAIYTPSGNTILQIPDVPQYRIKEGTSWIAPGAFNHCHRLRFLDIPCSMINHQEILSTYSCPLKYKVWGTQYDGTLELEEVDDEICEFVEDEYHVRYSRDGKILHSVNESFCIPYYEVPDGVEEISDFAFCSCRHYVELSIPRSVTLIGDILFGNGGHIKVRN